MYGCYTKGTNTPSVKRQRQGKRQNLGMGLGPILECHDAFQWTLPLPLTLGVGIALDDKSLYSLESERIERHPVIE